MRTRAIETVELHGKCEACKLDSGATIIASVPYCLACGYTKPGITCDVCGCEWFRHKSNDPKVSTCPGCKVIG